MMHTNELGSTHNQNQSGEQGYSNVPPPPYAFDMGESFHKLAARDAKRSAPVSPGVIDHTVANDLAPNPDNEITQPIPLPITPVMPNVEAPLRHTSEKDSAYAWAREEPVEYDSVREALQNGAKTLGRAVVALGVRIGQAFRPSKEHSQPEPTYWELASQGSDVPATPPGVFERGEPTAKLRRRHLGGPHR